MATLAYILVFCYSCFVEAANHLPAPVWVPLFMVISWAVEDLGSHIFRITTELKFIDLIM